MNSCFFERTATSGETVICSAGLSFWLGYHFNIMLKRKKKSNTQKRGTILLSHLCLKNLLYLDIWSLPSECGNDVSYFRPGIRSRNLTQNYRSSFRFPCQISGLLAGTTGCWAPWALAAIHCLCLIMKTKNEPISPQIYHIFSSN